MHKRLAGAATYSILESTKTYGQTHSNLEGDVEKCRKNKSTPDTSGLWQVLKCGRLWQVSSFVTDCEKSFSERFRVGTSESPLDGVS